jgi:hypothetical protein
VGVSLIGESAELVGGRLRGRERRGSEREGWGDERERRGKEKSWGVD